MGNVLTKIGAWCALAFCCRLPSAPDEMSEAESQPLLTETDNVDNAAAMLFTPNSLPPMVESTQEPICGTVTRTPKRRALLIGICYTGQCDGELETLKGSHKDVTDMKRLLIAHYGYREEDIALMMDSPLVESRFQPTKLNIKREMRELVKDVVSGDRLVFVFSGHSDQREEKQGDNVYPEEDGMDEVILTADGKKIRDNKLYKLMVEPLPVGAGLFAMVDSCHSGTMLDLPHHTCNSVYVPWVSKGKRRTGTMRIKQVRGMAFNSTAVADMPTFSQVVEQQESAFSIDAAIQTSRPPSGFKLRLNTSLQPASFMTSTALLETRSPLSAIQNSMMGGYLVNSPICESPENNAVCTGWCHDRSWKDHKPDVISLSACSDLQQAWEDAKGRSLVHLFCEYITSRLKDSGKQPTYEELMTHVNYQLYDKSVKVHRWTMKERQRAKSEGRSLSGFGEAVNFQTPELSSLGKLNLQDPFRM